MFTLCAVLSERARWGWYHYPRSVSHVSETLRGQVSERQTLPLLGLGRGCSRRTQKAFGAAMRLCASLFRRRRGPAGLRDPFSSVEIGICTSGAHGFPRVRGEGWYHYPQRALRAAETPDGRLSKRLTRRFLALPDSSLIPAAQNIVPFLYRCQKDQRDTRWSFHFCSHLLTCPDRPDRGT